MTQEGRSAAGRIVATLCSTEPAAAIEAGLVQHLLESCRVRDVENEIVASIAEDGRGERALAALQVKSPLIEPADLIPLFDLLLSPSDRRRWGMVSTPAPIAECIVQQTMTGVGTVCDCACGSGAFLLHALRRLDAFQPASAKSASAKSASAKSASAIEIIERSLYGADIHEASIGRAKVVLALHAILRGEDQRRIAYNLATADSLAVDWPTLFPRPFGEGGFDYVVGNPPYVRIQDIAPAARERLSGRWQTMGCGSFNLCFAFFELGRSILKQHGRLGFITPNTILTSLAAGPLRRYLHATGEIERIVTFHDRRVFDRAQTYTCMVFLEKGRRSRSFQYAAVDDTTSLAGPGPATSRYSSSWLDDRKWRLMAGEDFRRVRRIEGAGVPLGELASIRVGIATLRDDVFSATDGGDGWCRAGCGSETYPIEKAITRRIVRVCDIHDERDLATNDRRVIFPYVRNGPRFRLIPEALLRTAYPCAYTYLSRVRSALEGRDKGRKAYPAWYAWGRTQCMDPTGPRLYTTTFARSPRFVFDPGDGDPLFCNGYGIFPKEGPAQDHIRGLQRLLNSLIMAYYAKATSYGIQGGYQCYQKNFIERFGIPAFSEKEWQVLEDEDDEGQMNAWLAQRYRI